MTGQTSPRKTMSTATSATMPATMPKTALLLIDIQRGAFDAARCPVIDRAEELLANASALLAAARAAGTPVVFIQHLDQPGAAFEQDTPHGEFHAGVAPQPGETVLRKRASSAFENTELAATLQQLDAQQLVLCGLQSELCVYNTGKAALALGYGVRLAADGHSTWPSGGRSSEAISAGVNAELHALGAVLASSASLAVSLRSPD